MRSSGQLSRTPNPRRLMRPPQNVTRRPSATEVHISTTPMRPAQTGHPETRPPVPTSALGLRASRPQLVSEAANRFPSTPSAQTLPAPSTSFSQVQASPSISSNAHVRIPAATSTIASGQETQSRPKHLSIGQFSPQASLTSGTNTDFAASSLTQSSAALQPQFRGSQKVTSPSLPVRSRIVATPQQPLPVRVAPSITPVVSSLSPQLQMQQTFPQPQPQLPGVLAPTSIQQPQVPLASPSARQPAIFIPASLQHQPPFALRPRSEQPFAQRFQPSSQFTSPKPQIIHSEEFAQNQLQITRNSVRGEQESGPAPPAPQSGRSSFISDGAPGFLPPSDFVVNKLNTADDFMAIAESMQLKRRFKGQRRRRRRAEFRAHQRRIANLRS